MMNSRLMLLCVVTAAFMGIWTQDARRQTPRMSGTARQSRATVSQHTAPTRDLPSAAPQTDAFRRVRAEKRAAAAGLVDADAGAPVNVSTAVLPAHVVPVPVVPVSVASSTGRCEVDVVDAIEPASAAVVMNAARAVASECRAERLRDADAAMQRQPADEIATPYEMLAIALPLPTGIVPGCYRVVGSCDGATRLVQISDCDLAYAGIAYSYPAHDVYVAEMAERRWFFVRVDAAGYGDALVARELAPLPVASDWSLPLAWQRRLDCWRIQLQRGCYELAELQSRCGRMLRALPSAMQQTAVRELADWWSALPELEDLEWAPRMSTRPENGRQSL